MQSFFSELQRRNVFRVTGAYVVVAWLTMQVIAVMTPALNFPDWVDSFFAILFIAGLPIALLFVWAFELTPEGVKRTESVRAADSIRNQTGRKLDFAILGGLGLVVVLLIGGNLFPGVASAPGSPTPITELETPVAETGTSIAVLPFADMSAAGDQEYFSDGMAEEILNALVKIPDLRVAGRTSSFSFKGKDADIREIGQALNVAHILEGSVRKQGNNVRITAQLIESEDGIHLWSEKYDGDLDNIFDLQEEVSRAIARELKVLLNVGEDVRIAKKLTDSTEAYELFLRGRDKRYQLWEDGAIDEGVDLLEQAVEIDPNFADAWAILSRSYQSKTIYTSTSDDEPILNKARRAAYKALAINPEHKGAQIVLLTNDWLSGNLSATTDAFYQREAEFEDEPFYIFYRGYSAMALGHTTSALRYMEAALELEPLWGDTLFNLGDLYLRQGDFSKAREYAQRARDVGFGAAAITEAEIRGAEGDNEGAIEAFLAAYDEFGDQYSAQLKSKQLWELFANAKWGGNSAAKNQLVGFVKQILQQSDDKLNQAIVSVLLELGEPELFMTAYDRVQGNNLQTLNSIWDAYSEGAKSLRQHPDFPAFAERIGLLTIWQNHGWPDLCRPDTGTDGANGAFSCD